MKLQIPTNVMASVVFCIMLGCLMQCGDSNPTSTGAGSGSGNCGSSDGWALQNPYPPSEDLYDVEFVGKDNVWAVGYAGSVLRSTDGAHTWFAGPEFPAAAQDILFIDTRTGWVVGNNGMIMRTEDRGHSWEVQHSGKHFRLTAITFIDEQHGWIAGDYGVILSTNDGGEHWELQEDVGAGTLSDILFVDGRKGFAIGSNSAYENNVELLYTDDGGEHWTSIQERIPADLGAPDENLRATLHSIAAADRENITIVGRTGQWAAYGVRLQSRDGGDSWEVRLTREPELSVHYVNDSLGWIVGRKVFRTVDGGINWVELSGFYGSELNSVDFANSSRGCAVGVNGGVIRTDNGGDTWEKVSLGSRGPIFDIQFVDDLNGWTAGGGGVRRTTDGGITWEQTDCMASEAVCFLGVNYGFAVDRYGFLESTTNGGGTWVRFHDWFESQVFDMQFLDSLHGWVASGHDLFHTNDGGHNWMTQWEGNSYIYSLSFVDLNHGWIVNTGGMIMHTSDGGQTWEEQTSPVDAVFQDVFFFDKLHGWAAGGGFANIFTIDGGKNWHMPTNSQATDDTPRKVMFATTEIGWIVAYGGNIIATVDGGRTWVKQSSGTLSDLWALFALDDESVWAAGMHGTIIHTENGGW
ncbi:MAG: YCF48-related protein [candidate division Zixibacteria bacterium]